MSFCNNSNPGCPGSITNPSCNTPEKVCIQTTKIFDACIMQTSLDETVTLQDLTPANPTLPLTFVSGTSTSNVGTVSDLTVTPIADRSGLSRVRATVTIPISVTYTDANGVVGSGTSTISVLQDVIMCVPTGSIIVPTIAATVNMASPRGTFVDGSTFRITSCITVILKVQADVNLVISTYGYCRIPQCTEFSQDVCQGVFDMPIFPS